MYLKGKNDNLNMVCFVCGDSVKSSKLERRLYSLNYKKIICDKCEIKKTENLLQAVNVSLYDNDGAVKSLQSILEEIMK